MEKVNQVLEASPEETVEIEGIVRMTFKEIPTNPERIAEILGEEYAGQIPAGVDINQLANMYSGQITEVLNEHLRVMGRMEALVDLKMRSRTIPQGTYEFGLEFEGERPVAFVIRGEDLDDDGRPVAMRLQTRSVDLQDAVQIVLVEPRRQREGQEEFKVRIAFLRYVAQTSHELERDD